jgi:hypothetical protein
MLVRPLIFGAAAALLSLAPGPVAAQAIEELVVTATKTDYEPTETPFVALRRRADNLITTVTVVCDTRDLSQRRNELKATLRNLIRAAAQDRSIELGIGEAIVGAFDETMLDTVIEPGGKTDTSKATLIVKTAVTASDTFDAATARIKSFAERTPKVGRTEVLLDDEWDLTIINPGQYRPEVVRMIAADATQQASAFGPGYGVEVGNLQLPLSWYQSGPLDLALYIPYRLRVRPKP